MLSKPGAEFTLLDYPGHLNTILQRILPDGTILGCYHDNDTMDSMHGIAIGRGWTRRVVHTDVNAQRRHTDGKLIVGLFTDMDNRGRVTVSIGAASMPFEVPGARQTTGWDINQAGVAVGVFRDGAGKFHGFRYDGASFGSVDVPGATATRVFGINAQRDMVGSYVDSASGPSAFVAQWSHAN